MANGQTYIRRDIWSLDPDHPIVIGYGDAVAAMKAKSSGDPTSWGRQAAIHGSTAVPAPTLGDECRHQSWYFAPWHRMYLYWFEQIVRENVIAAGGPDDWALPFWDYDRDGTRALPEALRSPTRSDGSPNPLFVANRNPGINAGTTQLPSTITSAAFALARPDYTGTTEFGGGDASPGGQFMGMTGRLEATPHNDVHVAIGGLMLNPDRAAEDPVFWLHHCNVDRLWHVWNEDGHTNPTDPDWVDQTFPFFDEKGNQVSQACGDVVDIEGQLHYTYAKNIQFPRIPPHLIRQWRLRLPWPPWIGTLRQRPELREQPPRRIGLPSVIGGTEDIMRLTGDAERIRVPIDARARDGAASVDAGSGRIVLDIEDIDAERTPGTIYAIYVNLPDAPDDQDLHEHHAGNLSLFGIERVRDPKGDHSHGAMRLAMDITDLVQRLRDEGRMGDEDDIEVAFRPIELELTDDAPEGGALANDVHEAQSHEDTPIEIGRVSIRME